jgi:hypothetical protein
MKVIYKYKWVINWVAFAILIGIFIFIAIQYENRTWLPNVLQALGTISAVYLSLIIFLQSKEGSDKQFRQQLDHLQQLNAKQIIALQASTDRQINALQELNSKQIVALQDLTDKQISALQELTERQIEALQRTTFDQISSFEKEIKEVTNRLSENSILLAEILGRELEKSIDLFNGVIQNEQAKYDDLSGWKILRTPEEREVQLKNQLVRIEQLKKAVDYLLEKYNNVRKFLNFGQRKLN